MWQSKRGNTDSINDVVAALKSATNFGEWHPYIYLFPGAINITNVTPLGMSIFCFLSSFYITKHRHSL